MREVVVCYLCYIFGIECCIWGLIGLVMFIIMVVYWILFNLMELNGWNMMCWLVYMIWLSCFGMFYLCWWVLFVLRLFLILILICVCCNLKIIVMFLVLVFYIEFWFIMVINKLEYLWLIVLSYFCWGNRKGFLLWLVVLF